MAGLSVLLEEQEDAAGRPQIVCRTTAFLRHPFLPPPHELPPCSPTGAFLDACFLCRKHLSQEKDIYMYRGDRAFCSVECRCRQIFMDEEESMRRQNCSLAASPVRRRKRIGTDGGRHAAAPTGGFAY